LRPQVTIAFDRGRMCFRILGHGHSAFERGFLLKQAAPQAAGGGLREESYASALTFGFKASAPSSAFDAPADG
jgi:hypothetical protein